PRRVLYNQLHAIVFAIPIREQSSYLHLVDLHALRRLHVRDVPGIRPLASYAEKSPVSVLEELLEADIRLSRCYLRGRVTHDLHLARFTRDPQLGLVHRKQLWW